MSKRSIVSGLIGALYLGVAGCGEDKVEQREDLRPVRAGRHFDFNSADELFACLAADITSTENQIQE